jgi:hypothetical protein
VYGRQSGTQSSSASRFTAEAPAIYAQSSSASRFTAGAAGFLNLSQYGERQER